MYFIMLIFIATLLLAVFCFLFGYRIGAKVERELTHDDLDLLERDYDLLYEDYVSLMSEKDTLEDYLYDIYEENESNMSDEEKFNMYEEIRVSDMLVDMLAAFQVGATIENDNESDS